MNEHSGGRGAWGKLWGEEAQYSHALAATSTLTVSPCVQQSGSSLNSILLRVLWRIHHIGHDQSWTQSPIFPFLKDGGWGSQFLSFKSWLGLFGDQPSSQSVQDPTKSYLFITEVTLNQFSSKFQGILECCVRNLGQRANTGTKTSLVLLLGN